MLTWYASNLDLEQLAPELSIATLKQSLRRAIDEDMIVIALTKSVAVSVIGPLYSDLGEER
jgi:hypothetical protein